jgi:hypothetical protein
MSGKAMINKFSFINCAAVTGSWASTRILNRLRPLVQFQFPVGKLPERILRYVDMKFLLLLIIASTCGCAQWRQDPHSTESSPYSRFEPSKHLQPTIDKVLFDSLHSWDFGWALLEPINLAKNRADDANLSKRFSPGQKALYFIWYLDEEVTNGGFVQFYLNNYREYIPVIKDGLKLIGDTSMLALVEMADEEYSTHQKAVDAFKFRNSWRPLYEKPYRFDEYDQLYYATHDRMMDLIEEYVRKHPEEFVRFREE